VGDFWDRVVAAGSGALGVALLAAAMLRMGAPVEGPIVDVPAAGSAAVAFVAKPRPAARLPSRDAVRVFRRTSPVPPLRRPVPTAVAATHPVTRAMRMVPVVARVAKIANVAIVRNAPNRFHAVTPVRVAHRDRRPPVVATVARKRNVRRNSRVARLVLPEPPIGYTPTASLVTTVDLPNAAATITEDPPDVAPPVLIVSKHAR